MASASSNHRAKRMRLGTRSCAECRRRKVRCIFSPESTICRECLSHDTPCISQQPGPSPASVNSEKSIETMDEMQSRLQSLESMVHQLLNEGRGFGKPTITPSRAVEILSHSHALTSKTTMSTVASTVDDTPPSSGESFREAPLLKLLSHTLYVQSHDSTNNGLVIGIFRQPIEECMTALRALVPQIDDLLLILESTTKYWFIWPAQPPGCNEGKIEYPFGKAAVVKDFILSSFELRQPLHIVKSILWLALCIQQLPENAIQERKRFLPASPQDLFNAYLAGADILFAFFERSPASLTSLECLLLLGKVSINMGKPKRAWLATRKAINHALLLGLHRPNQSNNLIKQPLWSQVWQMDRQLSSILGVPFSVPYSQSRCCIDESIPAQIMHRINNVVCHIGDRNQGIGQHSIPEIETQIQECATLFPEEWFSLSTEGLSFEFIYARQVCLMYLMQLKKTLYLPDVLTALQNPEASQTHREHAVQACREMVSAYKVLRNSSKSALVICDLMDFLVFSAALVLALHLLAPPGPRNSSRDADDWAIITHLTLTFRQLSRAIECGVAKQAATLLEYLYAAHHHQYAGPEEYVAVIPWFGRVKISCVPRQQHITYLQTPSTDDNAESLGSCIEFGVNLLTPTTGSGNELESWSIQHMEEELGIDWTAFDDADWEYDWHQIFYSTNHYESTD